MHQTKRGLPVQKPMRGTQARRFDSVRVQTKVCRVYGLHPEHRVVDSGVEGYAKLGRKGQALNSPP